MYRKTLLAAYVAGIVCAFVQVGHAGAVARQPTHARHEYRVLATARTSTMEKEMNDAAAAGFRFGAVMGGQTAFSGQEVIVTMTKLPDATRERYQYRLLATNKTSTMQHELQEAGDAGFEYRGQSVFNSAFGGKEVVVILERDRQAATATDWEYRLVATKKTSTLERELTLVGADGFELVGLTVADTAMAGPQIVTIVRRKAN